MAWWDEIRRKLGELRARDRDQKIFGASSHAYRLNKPLSPAVVGDLERRFAVSFPDDYRAYLLELANGGAGPAHGIHRAGWTYDGLDDRRWEDGDGIGDPAKPFRFTARWNSPAEYWAAGFMDGAVPICDLGCNLAVWLVVSGPERGHVWRDLRADEEGVDPISSIVKDRVTFSEWYEDWLDAALRQVGA